MLSQTSFHPLSELFPLLEGSAFDELVADIKANGVREPVILYEGKILDGRNRYLACRALDVEAPVREYVGGWPLQYVISLNLHRRHLDASQRAMVAAKIANLDTGRPAAEAEDAISKSNAADVMHVSRTSVTRARKVLATAAPEVVAAVESGKVSVAAAHEIADAPRDEQAQAAKGGSSGVRKLAKQRRAAKVELKPTTELSQQSDVYRQPYSEVYLTSHERAEPKRRALYLWREFVTLKVTPAEFVRVAGAHEAATLSRSVAKFFLEIGRLLHVAARDKRVATRKKRTKRASLRARSNVSSTRKKKAKKIAVRVRPRPALRAKLNATRRKTPKKVIARARLRSSAARVGA